MSELVPVRRGGVVAVSGDREVPVRAWWAREEPPRTSCIPFAGVPEPRRPVGLGWRVSRRLLIEGVRLALFGPYLVCCAGYAALVLAEHMRRRQAPQLEDARPEIEGAIVVEVLEDRSADRGDALRR